MQPPIDTIAAWRPDGLAEAVWDALVHRLWHATTIQGLRSILNDGCTQWAVCALSANTGTGRHRGGPLAQGREGNAMC